MLQKCTVGHNHNVILLNRVIGDVHGAMCWPEVAGMLGSGFQTSELCLP